MMVSYPGLDKSLQTSLPALIREPKSIPNKFDDSTHRLWLCETTKGKAVLKVCDHAAILRSSFWHGINLLFGSDFPANIHQSMRIEALISANSNIEVPQIWGIENNCFTLSQYIDGIDLSDLIVSDARIEELAQHISLLHLRSYDNWGSIDNCSLSKAEWGARLQTALTELAQTTTLPLPTELVSATIALAGNVTESNFVMIMPDLRWDQFRVTTSSESLALIDLDAFVIGPASLELVLLEYVLTAQQFSLFKHIYTQTHDWPDYQYQKPCYQLLLFLMNVLGETDVERWMQQAE